MKKTKNAISMAFTPSVAVSALAGAAVRRGGRAVVTGIWATKTDRRGSWAWRALPV